MPATDVGGVFEFGHWLKFLNQPNPDGHACEISVVILAVWRSDLHYQMRMLYLASMLRPCCCVNHSLSVIDDYFELYVIFSRMKSISKKTFILINEMVLNSSRKCIWNFDLIFSMICSQVLARVVQMNCDIKPISKF